MWASEEDEDARQLQMAIRMSLGEPSESSTTTVAADAVPTRKSADDAKTARPSGLPGIDRKKMEQERLARIALRSANSQKRPLSPSEGAKQYEKGGEGAKRPRTEVIDLDDIDSPPPKAAVLVARAKPPQHPPSIDLEAPAFSRASKASDESNAPFAPGMFSNGTVKRTWVFGCERESDIKIEDVLQAPHLKTAMFSTFQLDYEWFHNKLQPTTKRMFIMGVKDADAREQWRKDVEEYAKIIDIRFPDMSGQINCMHSKLMILFFDKYVRIVVPTANLTKYDWGERLKDSEPGFIENTVFLIDLPRLETPHKSVASLPNFGKTLHRFLVGLEASDVAEAMLKLDFSKTHRMAFVHTMGGARVGHDAQENGYPGLSAAMRDLNLQSTNSLQLDMTTASLGSLEYAMLGKVYSAATGAQPKAGKAADIVSQEHLQRNFRVYFPTRETVLATKGGANAAGTLTLRKSFLTPKFPYECMRDHMSTRPGILSHSKLIYARGNHVNDGSPLAWLYVGSANLSESAWGRLVQDRSAKSEKLNCRNWECGVVIALDEAAMIGEKAEKDEKGVVPMSVFEQVLPPICDMPGQAWGDSKPWVEAEFHR